MKLQHPLVVLSQCLWLNMGVLPNRKTWHDAFVNACRQRLAMHATGSCWVMAQLDLEHALNSVTHQQVLESCRALPALSPWVDRTYGASSYLSAPHCRTSALARSTCVFPAWTTAFLLAKLQRSLGGLSPFSPSWWGRTCTSTWASAEPPQAGGRGGALLRRRLSLCWLGVDFFSERQALLGWHRRRRPLQRPGPELEGQSRAGVAQAHCAS